MIGQWGALIQRLRAGVDAEFASLTADERASLRVLELAPSLLTPLGLARDELTHSRLLAWFLSRLDAVGEACRRSFLERVGLAAPAQGWRVSRERDLGAHGRLDLHIDVPGAALIYVEVKIDAPERENQLRDYRAHLDEVQHGWPSSRLVFLTVDGRRGTGDAEHQHLGFGDLVAAWLPHATGNDPTAVYLAGWLACLARDVLRQAGEGDAAEWSLARRRSGLRLLGPTGRSRG
ncbi:MAG: PD-(D/E)XK nuclease family protein [Myxococcota bacterium]